MTRPAGGVTGGYVLLIAALAVLVGPASCSWKSADEVVGKWRLEQGTELIEFTGDGAFLQSDAGGPLIGGNYQRVSDDVIRVSFGGPASYAPPGDYRVTRSEQTLEIADPKGKTRRYARVE